MVNRMSKLIDKIERKLGLIPLTPYLPDSLNKESWANIIIDDSLSSFSRYFPYKVKYLVDNRTKNINGWYYINDDLIGNANIIGIGDIAWDCMTNQSNLFGLGSSGYLYNNASIGMSINDISNIIINANIGSMFNSNVYILTDGTNKFKVVSITDAPIMLDPLVIYIFISHDSSLATIEDTRMEIFERLAKADIAKFLYQNLKYYQFDTVLAQVDLKLNDLEQEGEKADQIREELQQSYVSAANKAMPMMMTI